MRWSPAKALPWSRSSASPSAMSLLASRIWISATRPLPCNANAAQDPTRPPPPMMVIFISLQLRQDLFRDGLNGGLGLWVIAGCYRRSCLRRHSTLDTRTPLSIVAQFAFLEAVPGIRDTEALFDFQQVLELQ